MFYQIINIYSIQYILFKTDKIFFINVRLENFRVKNN